MLDHTAGSCRGPLAVAIIGPRSLRQRCRAAIARADTPGVVLRTAELDRGDRLVRRHRPAAIVLDGTAAPVRALRLLPRLRQLSPASPVLIVAARPVPAGFLLEALRRGAGGYVPVSELAECLARALRAVTAGEPWLPRRLLTAVVAELRAPVTSAPAVTLLRPLRGTGERVLSSRRRRGGARRGRTPSSTQGA